ncbi:2-succinylbenzoate--CoA ligase [Pannus brasiliensis CCIBt3594]|uniref:2-succinylbenzoate--CoA ligase n=1 Tax=Pannus brasiliensis CCIBt3594 TaxID=1427578 RepID=A0AAW9QM10_9CHRO
MEDILTLLDRRKDSDWLHDRNGREFYQKVAFYHDRFRERSLHILLAESDPFEFLAIFLAGIASECSIFLGNPDWKRGEWEQVFALVRPDLVFGATVPSIENSSVSKLDFPPSILIPTGGTSGKIRFAIHTRETLGASVAGFREYFGVDRVNSFCILPLYHVSGLMQFLRCFWTEGYFLNIPYSELKKERIKNLDFSEYFISLVPTQLQFFLDKDPGWLTRFKAVLLGGAPAWLSLLEKARQYKIPLSPTYGMTETASQVVTVKPEEFLAGNNSNGRVLPHARIRIDEFDRTVKIEAKSLFLGYYPHRERSSVFQTDDVGYFDGDNYLYIIGRNSQKIITGGENVFPLEVETAIRETGLVKDVVVRGVSDRGWGQAIVAFYVSIDDGIVPSLIQEKIKDKIARYKHPKHWIKLDRIPKNPQGKINQKFLDELWNETIAKGRIPRNS